MRRSLDRIRALRDELATREAELKALESNADLAELEAQIRQDLLNEERVTMHIEQHLRHHRLSRRQLLQLGGVATTLALTGCTSALAGREASPPDQPPSAFDLQEPDRGQFALDLDVQLTANASVASILPGPETAVWHYQGRVLSGDPDQLQALPDTYLGPLFQVRRGQNVGVTFVNNTDEESIIHWHGLHVPPEMDGHPKDVVGPGQRYRYEFNVPNRAGTYWYHPHPHRFTGPQVYRGLAGFFLVHDEEEDAIGLPDGDKDVPLVIQDRLFDQENRLVYLPNGQMDRMMGMLGDRILVNGQADFVLDAAAEPYRLRLLNGSNSRIYKLAWSDDTPMTVIAVDGRVPPKLGEGSDGQIVPAITKETRAQGEHGLGTGATPAHTGLLHALLHERFGG